MFKIDKKLKQYFLNFLIFSLELIIYVHFVEAINKFLVQCFFNTFSMLFKHVF